MNQIEKALSDYLGEMCGMRLKPHALTGLAKAAIAAMPVQAEPVAGWIVGDADQDKWRTWGALGPEWTTDRDKATRYARRCDAEQVHAEDMDAWHVVPFFPPRPQEAVMQSDIVQRLNDCPDINHARIVPIGRRETEYVVPASVKFALIAEITRLTKALRAAEERERGLREALFNATALIGHSVPMDTTALVAGEQLTAQGVWLQGRDALAGAKP